MYSNSPNGATSKWIIRTSTPIKSSVYDFDPGPSTSFDPIVSLPRLNPAGQSSSKPKRRKGSIISMICEAIEAVGSPNKGASYIAICKWITNNRSDQTRSRRTLIRKEIAKGLETGLLRRSFISKKAVGVKGYFIVNEKYSSHNSRNNVKKPTFKITKNANTAKPNKVKTVKFIPKSQENQIPQSVLDSIMKTKDAFEEAAQSILQQTTKVLEVATKLIEASNSLVLNKVSEQNTDAHVERMQSRQDEEARVVSMHLPQNGQLRMASLQSPQNEEAGLAPTQSGQGEARVVPLQSPRGGEAGVAPIQSGQGEARVASMQFPQAEQARLVPLQSPQGGEAGEAPMQSDQGEVRVAQGTHQVVKERMALISYPQSGEARVAPKNEECQVAPMQLPPGGVKQVVRGHSSQDELLRAARIQSGQIGVARVASVQPFQILKQSLQIVDSSVDQHSSPFQVNNSPHQELSDEELSVERNLNFSSDSFWC